MLDVSDSTAQPLIEEAQLGTTLNQHVHSNKRSEFSLLLAMLTDDVRAFSQFNLPQSKTTEKTVSDEQLRKTFSLPEKQALAIKNLHDIRSYEQSALVNEGLLNTIKLQDCLKAKAIGFRDDKKHVPSEVMENTSLYCQLKHNKNTVNQLPEKREFDAVGFLNNVQETIVQSPFFAHA